MTPKELQDALTIEIEKILKDIICKTKNGEFTGIKAFRQKLTRKRHNISNGQIMPEENETEYPFFIVRVEDGKVNMLEGTQKISTAIVFGVFEDDPSCQGHLVITTMIQRIMEYFTLNPVLDGKYQMDIRDGMVWVLDDGEDHPYYYGSMIMSWDTFFVRREDRYA